MSTALAPVSMTLYEIEQDLVAYEETALLVTEEQRAQFEDEQRALIIASQEKRDSYGFAIRACDFQIDNSDKEVKRIEERKLFFQRLKKRLSGLMQYAIESRGTDDKGRYRRLDGKSFSFSLRANPPSVAVTNEDVVPDDKKFITVTLPLDEWRALVKNADIDLSQVTDKGKVCVSKTAIREAIDAGLEVPGADLNIGGHTLVIK
jgi:hypothetical protein